MIFNDDIKVIPDQRNSEIRTETEISHYNLQHQKVLTVSVISLFCPFLRLRRSLFLLSR